MTENEVVFAGERKDLEEVFGNLLENAMKCAHSVAKVSVEMASLVAEEPTRFSVLIEDEGSGIP